MAYAEDLTEMALDAVPAGNKKGRIRGPHFAGRAHPAYGNLFKTDAACLAPPSAWQYPEYALS
jgi:hypothetical protein